MKCRCLAQTLLTLVFSAGVMVMAGVPVIKLAAAESPVTLEVYNPTGAQEITQLFAPRLATLEGKTICALSNDTWQAQRTAPLILDLLHNKFPTSKIVPNTDFPTVIDDDKVADLVVKKGCQAVIVGNAG